MSDLVLASASQARAALLQAAGVSLLIDPGRIDEPTVKAAMKADDAPPRDIADKLAEMKALRISGKHSGSLVLGADQVLVHSGTMFDKPGDIAEARTHLDILRGKTHQLLSAAVICLNGEPVWRHVGQARLTMRPFSDAFLDEYLAAFADQVTTSVGGYHLEGLGAQLFARVEGDYFTVLGLPLLEVLGFLRARKVLTE